MKKVLIIANQFPPMGGSGVQRSVKFVKHLNKFGYEPVVFTRDVGNMILKDETLLNDIPDGTEIIRTKAFEPSELKGIMKIPGKVLSKIIIPDSARIWAEFSKESALNVVKKYKIDIVYTTSAPYSDHLIGLYIKEKTPSIVWAVDFRDEWTNNPYTLDNPYNPIRTNIEKKMEKKVLDSADILITNTPVMRENFIKNNNLKDDNFYVIPNGYDEEDFKSINIEKSENDKLTMVYTGALYGRRKPDTFFEALSKAISEGSIDGEKICVKLIGNYHEDKLSSQIASYNLTEQINIIGYVPHDVCIKYQTQADVLILIEGTGRGAEAFYTGKIFEYMNTGKPVLAVLPENGAAASLVRKSKIGIVAHTDDVSKIKESIIDYYKKWENKCLNFEPDRNVIEQFERKRLTEELAKLFDKYLKESHN